jgi:hypothetical protein
MVANLLEKPSVVKWLTEPTEAQIASIPPELRGNITKLAQEAQKQGIKVDPRLYAAAGVAAAPKKRVAAAMTR